MFRFVQKYTYVNVCSYIVYSMSYERRDNKRFTKSHS